VILVEVSEEGLWERWEDAVRRDGLGLVQVQNWKVAARNTTLEAEDKGGHSLTTGQSTTEEEVEEEEEEKEEEEGGG
jgi:C4-type Zn-finger protein